MLTLATIQQELGGTLHPPRQPKVPDATPQNTYVHGLQTLVKATTQTCSFLSNPKYQQQLATTQAVCVIVSADMVSKVPNHAWTIEARNPYAYYARLSQLFRRNTPSLPQFTAGVHPTAYIAPTAKIDSSAHIGPMAVIEEGATIGAHTVIRAHATIGYHCRIGTHAMVHSGATIGADGFGFAPEDGKWHKIEQLGNVLIGNHVEIGANTCIDRGALSDTVIEDGVKLDNLIQIAHNVHIGAHTAIAACVGIAGSARIGTHCTIGGGAIVLGHLSIADHTHISAASVVSRSLHEAGNYSGFFPIDKNADWERNAAALKQLYHMRKKLRRLEQQ